MKNFRSFLHLQVILVLFNFATKAQDAKFKWAKTSDGYATNVAYALALDAGGNVYTAGYFCGGADFDPGPSTHILSSISVQDVFISKFDSTGNFIWAKNMGGWGSDLCQAMVVDAAGDLVLTGRYELDFNDVDSSNTNQLTFMGHGQSDVFIVKLNANGSLLWAKFLGSKSYEDGMSVTSDPANNIYVSGYFSDTVDFDPGPGIENRISKGGSDAFILKLDAAGNFVWVKTWGGNADEFCNAVSLDNGNLVLSGVYFGTADFDPGPGVYNLSPSGYNETFVLRLDASGNLIWAKSFGGSGNPWSASSAVDPTGNTYCIGTYTNSGDFDPGPATSILTCTNPAEQYLVKLDPNGNLLWAASFGNVGDGFASNLTIDKFGDVYLTGAFSNLADLDPGFGVVALWAMSPYNDAYVLKMNSTGSAIWVKRMGGVCGASMGVEIAMNSKGAVYSAGGYFGAVDFDPGPYVSVLSCDYVVSNYHYYIQKLQEVQTKTTALQELSKSKNPLKVYPNPTNGKFQIADVAEDAIKIEVEDLQGRLILEKKAMSGKNTVDLSEYASQVYIIRLVYSDQTQETQKLVKTEK